MAEKEQQNELVVKELDGGRALTRAEFHQLSDVPPAVEWFANIRNRHTRRPYARDVGDFSHFVGIKSPNEFRIVTRAHVIAWRDKLVGEGKMDTSVRPLVAYDAGIRQSALTDAKRGVARAR